MGLSLPSELTEPLGWIGLTWPAADEELLFAAGQTWLNYSASLDRVKVSANSGAESVWGANQGQAVGAFRSWWTKEDGPDRRLSDDAQAAEIIGTVLIMFAALTLIMKIAFIVQLIILLVQVTMAIVSAFATAGASTATIPGFVAATRAICLRLLKQVVKQVQTALKQLLENARKLLKKSKYARKVDGRAPDPGDAARLAKQFEDKLADDLRRVNPNFDANDPAWGGNCTNCATAYELRRRGIDAEAAELPSQYHAGWGRPGGQMNGKWGFTYKPSTQADIVKEMENFGPGSRGFVRVTWPGGGAHIFNVENVAGKVRFVDGQPNVGDAAKYFGKADKVFFHRSDDLPMPKGLDGDYVNITS